MLLLRIDHAFASEQDPRMALDPAWRASTAIVDSIATALGTGKRREAFYLPLCLVKVDPICSVACTDVPYAEIEDPCR
jgi:hypothetical protein